MVNRNRHSLFTTVVAVYMVSVMLIPQVAFAEPVKEGDQPKGLQVILPWTIRLCGDAKTATYYGTYTALEALELKKTDADCTLWKEAYPKLIDQVKNYKLIEAGYKTLVESHKVRQANDDKRISELTAQLMTEIAEKNKYKYQPTYGWIWAIVGGGVALIATGFAVGFGVAYAKK
jgi:hypothetical protein